jgi:hypothetical protein
MSLSDLGDVARMASRLPEELQKAQVKGVGKAALTVTRGIRGEIRSASGGDNRLSGVGKRGARVGAKYDVKGTVNPSALIVATGPMQLLEHPTRPHGIQPRTRGKKKALKFRDGTFARSASHPGTKPSRPFEKGYMKTRAESGPAFDKEIQNAIRRVLG